jgi:Spy/CpxP family protein refolding chaperone
MKRLVFLACFSLTTANAQVQNTVTAGSGPVMSAMAMPGPMNQLDFLAALLSLSSSQADQAKPLFDAERDAIKNAFTSMKQAQDALTAAEKSDQPDSEIDRLAAAVGTVQGQLAAIHSKTMMHFRTLLTSDQKDKLDKFSGPSVGFGVSGVAISTGTASH